MKEFIRICKKMLIFRTQDHMEFFKDRKKKITLKTVNLIKNFKENCVFPRENKKKNVYSRDGNWKKTNI